MIYRSIAPALVWAVLIMALTLNPWIPSIPEGPWSFSGVDLVAHLIFFGVQSFLLSRGFERQTKNLLYNRFYGSLAMTYTSLFGIFVELVQYYIPTRFFSYFDIIADILGAILGYLAYRILIAKGIRF